MGLLHRRPISGGGEVYFGHMVVGRERVAVEIAAGIPPVAGIRRSAIMEFVARMLAEALTPSTI
jgi:hypothetical protein